MQVSKNFFEILLAPTENQKPKNLILLPNHGQNQKTKF